MFITSAPRALHSVSAMHNLRAIQAENERLARPSKEQAVERDPLSSGAAGNDNAEGGADHDGPSRHSLPAGPLHRTQLLEAAKEGKMLVNRYEDAVKDDQHEPPRRLGRVVVDPALYDPYTTNYMAEKRDEQWRPFRPLPVGQEEDPDAFCIGRKGCYTSLVGCAAFLCMSVFAFFIIVILFYLEDFGDIDVWINGAKQTEAASPPPPAPLVGR